MQKDEELTTICKVSIFYNNSVFSNVMVFLIYVVIIIAFSVEFHNRDGKNRARDCEIQRVRLILIRRLQLYMQVFYFAHKIYLTGACCKQMQFATTIPIQREIKTDLSSTHLHAYSP